MSLLSLNYDILSHICSVFKTRRSLLDLALTCRTLHSVIIPAFLYERLELLHRLGDPASLERFQSFIHAIHVADSTAADAVRHMEIRDIEGLRSFWIQSIPLMRNLRSITSLYWDPPLKRLSLLPHLHTLWLCGRDYECLDPLRELRGLRNLTVAIICAIRLTLDSALVVALLNSRDTLMTLTLSNFEWQLPPHAANLGELIWPRVVKLGMWSSLADSPTMDVNFAHHFPSVRQFGCTATVRWNCPSNMPFISRLVSLDAPLSLTKVARDVCAPLQRATIYVLDDYLELGSYLPPDIRSVKFQYGAEFTARPFRHLEGLAAVCSKVTYLAVDCRHYRSSFGRVIMDEVALQSLSNLSIECLSLTWPLGEGHGLDRHDLERFAACAFWIIPSLRFIALHPMYNCTTYWRKSIGPDEALAGLSHCQVSDEEGPDYVNYYEWRWRDQPEYTAEMDKDA